MRVNSSVLFKNIKNYENLTEEEKDYIYDTLYEMTEQNSWGETRKRLVRLYFKKLKEIANGNNL